MNSNEDERFLAAQGAEKKEQLSTQTETGHLYHHL